MIHRTRSGKAIGYFSGWAVAVAFWAGLQSAAAQEPITDTVTFSDYAPREFDHWKPIATVTLAGKILDFDSDYLTLLSAEGKQSRYPSRQVVDISFQWATPEAKAATLTFERQEYREAVAAIQACYKELPRWQQRQILAKLVVALDVAGGPRIAGILFLDLAKAKPPAMLYSAMPLCWTVREPDRALAEAAAGWIASQDESARLLGASWLSTGSRRSEAQDVLHELKSSKNPTIGALATAQSWRWVPPPKSELSQWFEYRDRLIAPLQLGPTEFLADRLQRLGKPELALGQWMRIASLYPERYHRFSAATDQAIGQLKQMQRDGEAQRLEAWKLAHDSQ